MLAKKIIRAIMDDKGIGMAKMADMLGFAYPMKVTNRLETVKSRNISTDKLDEMVRVLGYKVIVVPEGVKLKDGWYEIDDSRNTVQVENTVSDTTEDLKTVVDVLSDIYPNADVSGIAIERISDGTPGSD